MAPSFQQQLSDLTPRQKLMLMGLGMVLLGVGAYYLFYEDLLRRADAAASQGKKLAAELEDYQGKRRTYRSTLARRDELTKRQKDVLQILPKKSEIPSLLEQLQAQSELAGLEVRSFERRPEVVLQHYARIPVSMEISGSYHQFVRLFHLVSRLKRIVNVGDLSMSEPTVVDRGVRLKVKIEAATFRFLEKGEKPRPGAPRPPAGRPGAGRPAEGTVPAELAAAPLRESDFVEGEHSRDPFRQGIELFALKRVARGEKGGRKVLLDKYALEELKLIAVISGIPDARAMLREPGGVGYAVRRGDYVSKNEARVVQILGDRVVVAVETTDEQGRISSSERVLSLQPEAPAATAPAVR